jgi:hypothetical protein
MTVKQEAIYCSYCRAEGGLVCECDRLRRDAAAYDRQCDAERDEIQKLGDDMDRYDRIVGPGGPGKPSIPTGRRLWLPVRRK